MAQIRGLHSHNFNNGDERLIAVWARTPVTRLSSSWIIGPGITLTSDQEAHMTSMIDKVFLVNGVDNNAVYNGSVWSQTNSDIIDSPIGKYITDHTSRVFLYNIKILGTSYKSRCWFSDLPNNGTLTWGLETGTDLSQTSGSAEVTSAGSDFISRNIKVGDPFFITTGTNARNTPYVVQALGDTDGDNRSTIITLTEELTNTATSSSFWVGSNWFDVKSDDGDEGTGLGYTSNEIFLFKKGSVHRYNVSGQELRRVKSVPGTLSPRSILSWGDSVYWHHPTGIYQSSGSDGIRISDAISDVIENMTSSNQTLVVGWINEVEETLNWYIGDTQTSEGDSISNCVVTFDIRSQNWSFRSYGKVIKCATNWLHSNTPEIYVGDDNAGVFQIETGLDFNGDKIPMEVIIPDIYPEGSETTLTFNRLRLYITDGPDVHIQFRLKYKPTEDGKWVHERDWTPLDGTQNAEKSEWVFPPVDGSLPRAAGIDLNIIESSGDKAPLIEKIVIYTSDPSNY